MKNRPEKILGVLGVVLGCYFAAYFMSVTTTHLQIKAVYLAVPVYRPIDASVVRTIFAPAQLLDAEWFRPSRLRESTIR